MFFYFFLYIIILIIMIILFELFLKNNTTYQHVIYLKNLVFAWYIRRLAIHLFQ